MGLLSTLGNIGENLLSGGLSQLASFGLGSLLGTNNKQQQNTEKTLSLQNQYWQQQQGILDRQQRSLLQDQAGLTTQGMRSAGLNPAFQNGGSISPAVSSAPSGSGGIFNLANLSQDALALQQAKLVEQQTRQLQIQNDREQNRDNTVGQWYVTEFLEGLIPDEEFQALMVKLNPKNILPNLGSLEGLRDVRKQVFETFKNENDIAAERFKYAITSAQMSNPDVKSALELMPVVEYDRILKACSKLSEESGYFKNLSDKTVTEKEMLELKEKLLQNSSIQGIVDKIKTGNDTLDSILKAIVLCFTSMFSASARLG